MCARWGILLAAHLTIQIPDPGTRIALQTIEQRDAFRSSTHPSSASVSADGRFVAFASYARLVAGDSNDHADVYLLDRHTGGLTLESVDSDGAPLDGSSGHPRLSGDGRYLVFESAVAGAVGDPVVQVALRDRLARTTIWIGRSASGAFANGWSAEPAISADGSVIVFTSAATDLVAGPDANGHGLDVYLYVRTTGELSRVSLDSDGRQPAASRSYAGSVSDGGLQVAFVSTADLGDATRTSSRARPNGGVAHVYVRDTATGMTRRITESPQGQPGNGASGRPVLSADGRHVAFSSLASNLMPGDRNRAPDVFLHDLREGTTSLVSRSAGRGAANGASLNPAISDDGRFVAYQSEASDLLCSSRCPAGSDDINLLFDVFLYDRVSGTTVRVSSGPTEEWMAESGGPALAGAGGVVAFSSRHRLDPLDVGRHFDLYILARPERPQLPPS